MLKRIGSILVWPFVAVWNLYVRIVSFLFAPKSLEQSIEEEKRTNNIDIAESSDIIMKHRYNLFMAQKRNAAIAEWDKMMETDRAKINRTKTRQQPPRIGNHPGVHRLERASVVSSIDLSKAPVGYAKTN